MASGSVITLRALALKSLRDAPEQISGNFREDRFVLDKTSIWEVDGSNRNAPFNQSIER
jgi:hypothetical protein